MVEALCCVCGEAVDDSNSADCVYCHQPYHLRLREDSDDKDCGEVWISPEHLALEFGCSVCLDGAPPSGSLAEPPVGMGH